jgi:DNA-binding transcriptional regulator YhcF (GntR family)
MSDEWAEAWSALTNALEKAKDAGMTEEEIEDCVSEVYAERPEYIPGKPKPTKEQP